MKAITHEWLNRVVMHKKSRFTLRIFMKKAIALFILLVVSFAPLTYPLIFPYNPPLEAIDSYETHHVTDTTYFGNLTKNFQSLKGEVPCTYTILGWDQDDNLYYRSVCEGLSETYVYSPTAQTNSIRHFRNKK